VRATSGQCQSLAVAAPASNALDHPPPANSSASLSLTRPAFVCVLCICHTHPRAHTHDPSLLRRSLGTLPRWPPLCPQRTPAHRRLEPPNLPHTHAMSRLQYDQFVDDDEDECCPLCVEEFDLSDRNFRPCPCGYQVRPCPRPRPRPRPGAAIADRPY
jgi:hypothetical protein